MALRPRRPTRRRLAYAAMAIVIWTLPQIRGTLSVFRDGLQSYLDISIDQFGLLISIGSVTGMVGSLLAGRLVDRHGPRVVLRVCLVGAAAGLAMAGLVDRWLLLLAALALTALFAMPLWIASQAYLVRLFPTRRRRVLSLSLVAMSLTGIAVPLLAEGLLHLHRTHPAVRFGTILHVPFAVVAVLLAGAVVLYRPGKSLARPKPAPLPAGPASRRLHVPGAMLLVGALAVHGTCDTSAMLWMPRVLGSSSYLHRPLPPGVVTAGFSVAYVLARGLLSLLPEHFGRRVMIIAPGAVGGALFLAGVLSRSQSATAACYVLGGFCWSFEFPAILSTLAGGDGRRFGASLGMMSVGAGLGTFALANVMGVLAKSLGEPWLWMVLILPACGFGLVSLIGAVWVLRFGRCAGQNA